MPNSLTHDLVWVCLPATAPTCTAQTPGDDQKYPLQTCLPLGRMWCLVSMPEPDCMPAAGLDSQLPSADTSAALGARLGGEFVSNASRIAKPDHEGRIHGWQYEKQWLLAPASCWVQSSGGGGNTCSGFFMVFLFCFFLCVFGWVFFCKSRAKADGILGRDSGLPDPVSFRLVRTGILWWRQDCVPTEGAAGGRNQTDVLYVCCLPAAYPCVQLAHYGTEVMSVPVQGWPSPFLPLCIPSTLP